MFHRPCPQGYTARKRALIITTVRNECSFLLEWIAYHQHIGFTDFLIYSNDCADGTDVMLDRLQERGVVTHVANQKTGQRSVQWQALKRAFSHKLHRAADWIYVTDIDEFLCIHPGDGLLQDLFDACPKAEGFAVPWRMFGNDGVITYQEDPILTQFTKAAPDALLWPWRAVQFKSLYKADHRYDRLGLHQPRVQKDAVSGHWVDGNGATLKRPAGTVIQTQAPRYGLAQINHYALGSMESFLVKVARGKPDHTSDPIDLEYWVDRNFSVHEDRSILRHADAVADRVKDLRRDAEVDRLHLEGVVWRQAQIAHLRQETDMIYLLSRIMQAPATQVLPVSTQTALFEALMKSRQVASSQHS